MPVIITAHIAQSSSKCDRSHRAVIIHALAPVIVPLLLVMAIAKFALVVLFFMHLRYDRRVLTVVFVGPILIALLVSLALMTLTGHFLVFD